jgi:hypothetical protein
MEPSADILRIIQARKATGEPFATATGTSGSRRRPASSSAPLAPTSAVSIQAEIIAPSMQSRARGSVRDSNAMSSRTNREVR